MLRALHAMLVDLYPDESQRPRLLGPDVGNKAAMAAMQSQAAEAGVPLYAVNYHSYSHDLTPASILQNSAIADSSVFHQLGAGSTQLWIGEAGSCGGGGRPNMSDTFANGFWYLRALGRLAQLNHTVFLRQDLVGAWYGLLRDGFAYNCTPGSSRSCVVPNVDYFSAVLFKRLMGRRVLNTSTTSDAVDVYAHCTPAGQGKER